MKITVKLNYLRIAPRKVRLVADILKNKKIDQARAVLNFTVKRGSGPLLKLLNSAVSNAKNNFQLDEDNLYISKITVDEGPKLKRWRARSRGRAMEIQKRTSHITLVLDEIKPGKKIKKKRTKPEKEVEKRKIPSVVKKETTKKEIDAEEMERQKEREVSRREKRAIAATPKPQERGGIKRFFRRKSF